MGSSILERSLLADDIDADIQLQKSHAIDYLMIAFCCLAAVAVAGSVTRVLDLGWHPVLYLHIGILTATLAVTIYRKRFSATTKVFYMLSVNMVAAVSSLAVFGMLGVNQMLFLLVPVMAAALLSTRAAMLSIFLIASILLFMLFSVGVSKWQLDIDSQAYIHSTTSWGVLFTSYLFVSLIAVLVIAQTRTIVEDNLREIYLKKLHLEEAKATRDKLFSVVAHDLRSPFNGLISIMKLLVDDQKTFDEEEKARLFEQLLRNSEITAVMLENLLTWSRVQLGVIKLEKTEFNLAQTLELVMASYRKMSDEKSITIKVNVSSDLMIFADLPCTQIVFSNLLANAIKFTPVGGHISISAEVEQEMLLFVISDTGIGISEAQQKSLFSEVVITPAYGTDNEKGTGLGLNICRDLVERNDGQIWLESVEGKGTTVFVKLPQPEGQSG